MNKITTIGNALDYVQVQFGGFGFANMLPHLHSFTKDELNTVIPVESNDPMVQIFETDNIFFFESSPVVTNPFFRKKAWEQLLIASEYLPKGLSFGIIETHRSKERQEQMRVRRFNLLKDLNPLKANDEIWKMVNTFIAGVGGPHQTGGAIDITLMDRNTRVPLDMGSPKAGVDRRSYTASNMVTLEAQIHRYILCSMMTHFGFRNYPAEWWHYEFGTKRHAKYQNFDTCIYSTIE